jgi:aminomethyltransferase
MTGRAIARPGYGVFSGDDRLGAVTSGTHAPWVKKNIGLAYLPRGKWEPGTQLEIEIRGRREGAQVVATPFYKRRR